MKKKWIQIGMVLFFSVILTGCYSYRLLGDHAPIQSNQIPTVTFRLRNFEMQYEKPHAYAIASASSVKKKDIERALLSSYPDLFTQSSASLPLDVEVEITDMKMKTAGATLVFICTLGTLAPSFSWAETCNIYVDVDGLDSRREHPETLRLMALMRASYLSPLGRVLPADPAGYSGVQRSSSCISSAASYQNEYLKDLNDVFIGEVVAGIVNALIHRDQNDLNRAALLQRLRTN